MNSAEVLEAAYFSCQRWGGTPQGILENLRDAADLLRYHGWTKFRSQDSQDRFCLHGAVDRTGEGFNQTYTTHQFLSQLGYTRSWNDDFERDVEDVLFTLDSLVAHLAVGVALDTTLADR